MYPTDLLFILTVSYWMYEAEKYHGVSIKKLNEEYLDQIVASCPLKLSEQGGESSDYDKIVRCLFIY